MAKDITAQITNIEIMHELNSSETEPQSSPKQKVLGCC